MYGGKGERIIVCVTKLFLMKFEHMKIVLAYAFIFLLSNTLSSKDLAGNSLNNFIGLNKDTVVARMKTLGFKFDKNHQYIVDDTKETLTESFKKTVLGYPMTKINATTGKIELMYLYFLKNNTIVSVSYSSNISDEITYAGLKNKIIALG